MKRLSLGRLRTFIKTHIFVDKLFVIRTQFKRDDVRLGLRLNYPLTKESVVFDLGGYKGGWSEKIYDKYQCQVY